jgi:predicted RNase H-like HicB family nuclease
MRSYAFNIVVEEDRFEDGRPAYHSYCPALEGCHSWGHTYDEAVVNVREAIELYVEDMIQAGQSLPVGPDTGVVELAAPSIVVNG